MPRPAVQAVGALLALTAAGSFAMGVVNAPERGRLPGERAPGQAAGPVAPIAAAEATPLAQERIEAPAPPPKKEEADDSATEDQAADQADQPTPPKPTNATAGATNSTAPDANTTAPPPSPDDEPPH